MWTQYNFVNKTQTDHITALLCKNCSCRSFLLFFLSFWTLCTSVVLSAELTALFVSVKSPAVENIAGRVDCEQRWQIQWLLYDKLVHDEKEHSDWFPEQCKLLSRNVWRTILVKLFANLDWREKFNNMLNFGTRMHSPRVVALIYQQSLRKPSITTNRKLYWIRTDITGVSIIKRSSLYELNCSLGRDDVCIREARVHITDWGIFL